jgi:hypothetical protein
VVVRPGTLIAMVRALIAVPTIPIRSAICDQIKT